MNISNDKRKILNILSKLHDKHKKMFQLMYASEIDYEDISDNALQQTVSSLGASKVKYALSQCQRTYYGLFDRIKNSHI